MCCVLNAEILPDDLIIAGRNNHMRHPCNYNTHTYKIPASCVHASDITRFDGVLCALVFRCSTKLFHPENVFINQTHRNGSSNFPFPKSIRYARAREFAFASPYYHFRSVYCFNTPIAHTCGSNFEHRAGFGLACTEIKRA